MIEVYLQWIGAAFGISGSALLAMNNSLSKYGFLLFMVSNLFWIAFGILTWAPGLVVMQLAFVLTSALGIYRWLWSNQQKAQPCKS